MLTKDSVIKSIDKLPDSFTIDELIDKLVFMEKVQKGLDESNSGQAISGDQARLKLSKWLK